MRNFIMLSIHSFHDIPTYCYISTSTGAGFTLRSISVDAALAMLQWLEQLPSQLDYSVDDNGKILKIENYTMWHS